MYLESFKSSKKIELSKAIKTYVSKHYDMNAVKSLESIINEIEFARNEAISVASFDKSTESLNKAKSSIIAYLRLLGSLRQRMTFGKDDMSVKVSFSWYDVLKKDHYTSYSYAHEYYNNLFNLAICLFHLGKSVNLDESEENLKVSIKNFNYAAWIFNKIKQELPQNVTAKEIQPDLNQSYLTYCSYFSLAHSQVLIYIVSERKKMNPELQAQLTKGIYDLFSSCIQACDEGLKNYADKIIRVYLNNRRFFYFSQGFLKFRDVLQEEFKTKGNGYGKMIAYTSLAIDALNAGAKDLKLLNQYVNVEEYEAKLSGLNQELTVMNKKNKEIYYDAVPNSNSLPKFEKKIMANPAMFPEDLNKSENYQEALKDLVPKEVKIHLQKYKEEMMGYISSNLEKYQNECKVDKFLLDMNLPGALESALNPSVISDYLWDRINEVQQKGGPMLLESNMKNIEGLKEDVNKKINALFTTLGNEQEEDNKLRQMYGNKWYRQPSSNLNNNYYAFLNQFKQKIEIASKCDENVNNTIKESMKHFELINLSRQSLERKIPVKVNPQELSNIPEAKELKDALENIKDLKIKNSAIVEKIFLTLNEENVIPMFLNIIRKSASESQFMKDQHEKFYKMFNELEALEIPITEAMQDVIKKNDAFMKIKESKLKPNPDNDLFFKELESYCVLYNQKLTNLYQGMNFYSELIDKVDNLKNSVGDYLFSRDLEKNDMLKQLGGQNINTNQFHDFSKQQPGQGQYGQNQFQQHQTQGQPGNCKYFIFIFRSTRGIYGSKREFSY